MNVFFLILFSVCHGVSVRAMDIDPSYANDKPFLLWCGVLTCKQIKSEDTLVAKPREFLGISEEGLSNKDGFYIPRETYRKLIDNNVIAPGEKIFTDSATGIRDRRLGRYWRCLDSGKPEDHSILKESDDDESFKYRLDRDGRLYTKGIVTHSCGTHEDRGQLVILQENSVPHEGGYYLYPGICAHKDENIWIKCHTLPMIDGFFDNSADSFPIYVMWVEKFRKPLILSEFTLPAKDYEITDGSVAVKFINNDTEFQIYYDCSGKRIERITSPSTKIGTCTFTVEGYKEHRDTPSYKLVTYTLNRMRSCMHGITPALMRSWYTAFNKFKEGLLEDSALEQAKKEMLDAVYAVENMKNF